jgi:hypothetical protein
MTENLTFQAIPIDSITLDPDLVVRHKPIDRRHIERMLPLAKSGGEFPPVRIFEDDEGVRRSTAKALELRKSWAAISAYPVAAMARSQ